MLDPPLRYMLSNALMDIPCRWLMLLVFAVLLAEVQAPPRKDICRPSSSSILVQTSFDALSVEEVKWKIKSSQGELFIGTFKDGKVIDGWNDQYKPLDNGTKLVIDYLTEKNTWIIIAEATFMYGELRTETINVTVCGEDKNEDIGTRKGEKRNHISRNLVFFIVGPIVVIMGSVIVIYKYRKRSSDTSGQDDQNNEASVNVPIQDTRSQESSFIKILHEKSEYKDQEDVGSKVRNKPSCDHNSVY